MTSNDTTAHLAIPLLHSGQKNKEIAINEALARMDALLNTGALSIHSNTPPATPSTGDVHIVGTSPTGAWAGQAARIAFFDQIWRFIAPKTGARLWVEAELAYYGFNGTAWNAALKAPQGITIGSDGTPLTSYKTGSFTPRFGAVVATYTAQNGRYTLIGNLVFCEVEITVTALTVSDPDKNIIADLPFSMSSAGYIIGSIDIESSTLISKSAGRMFQLQPYPGNTTLLQIKNEQGVAYTYNSGAFNASGTLRLAFSYRI